MGWWPWAKRVRSAVRFIRAKFDSAQTTPENRRHWANADGLAANAAANPEVRRTLRNRARYEVANNSYARGIVLTLANDVIGTGPRLQMLLGDGADAGANQTIEREFAAWAKAIDLAGKLRTLRMGAPAPKSSWVSSPGRHSMRRKGSGKVFPRFRTNRLTLS
jgi:capsid protein